MSLLRSCLPCVEKGEVSRSPLLLFVGDTESFDAVIKPQSYFPFLLA